MHLDEFDFAAGKSILTISSEELPEVKDWEVNSTYNIRKVFTNAKQVRKTELEDGRVIVALEIKREDPQYEGELVKK